MTLSFSSRSFRSLAFGMISFAALEIATGHGRRQHWMLYLLAALFLMRFVYLARV